MRLICDQGRFFLSVPFHDTYYDRTKHASLTHLLASLVMITGADTNFRHMIVYAYGLTGSVAVGKLSFAYFKLIMYILMCGWPDEAVVF